MRRLALFVGGLCLLTTSGCIVEETSCDRDSECGAGRICEDHTCRDGCRMDRDCPAGQDCVGTVCVPASSDGDADSDMDCDVEIDCPDDMVPICGYCMDIHEASRPDATESSAGTDSSVATSRAGVIPWMNMSLEEARSACEAAGKRLCTAEEWVRACRGPDDTDYPYGNTYDPEICNGIDTYGRGNQRIMPTGSFPECTNEYGVYDLSGNLWEVDGENFLGWVHGGAYNCIDSRSLHLCSYNQDFTSYGERKSNVGFRCCSDGN